MQLADAIETLRATPAALQQRLAGLSPSDLCRKPSAENFSMLENVYHLRDIEVEGYARRLELLLVGTDPVLPDLDGAALARERRYNSQPCAPALEAFLTARRANLEQLATVTSADLERRGHFENVGVVTLGRLLEMWVEHDREHLAEMDALLASLPETTQPLKPSLSLT